MDIYCILWVRIQFHFVLLLRFFQLWLLGTLFQVVQESMLDQLLRNWASLVAHSVKSLPLLQETQIHCLSRENPLEKGMATHSSVLAWRIPWTEEPGGLQSIGLQRVGHD